MCCKFLGYLSIRWIVICCVAYLLTLQDDPLLFDYNVQDRVNDFVAVSFSQVWLWTSFHLCLVFPSKALLKLGCIYCYWFCIFFFFVWFRTKSLCFGEHIILFWAKYTVGLSLLLSYFRQILQDQIMLCLQWAQISSTNMPSHGTGSWISSYIM